MAWVVSPAMGAAPVPLVSHGDTWHYRKGTNEPQADWRTAADAGLDATWLTGPGGFGYGDPGIGGEATTLGDMLNRYTTLYMRRTFEIVSPVDTNMVLQLVVDFDDGFIAYLDGAVLPRANMTNSSIATFPYNATTGGTSHEASCCNAPTNAPLTNNLGAVANRLPVGQHVLALHGANQAIGSSDFHLIPDLYLVEPTTVGPPPGTLTNNTTWTAAMSPILVFTNIIVPTNITLTMEPGTVVKISNSVAIRAVAGGTINIAGAPDSRVILMPMVGSNLWRELSAQFPGSSLHVQNADIAGGQISVYSNAVGLIEDSYVHNYVVLTGGGLLINPIILTHFAAPTTIRRCHVSDYYEVLLRNGIETVEECLFEHINGDGVDFDSALPGSVVRWCTFRHGDLGNVDAVDVGPGDVPGSTNLRIENCVMFDFPFDKGVSVGDNNSSHGIIVSNCLIYNCLSGVMAKDLCDVSVRNCTIVNNNSGFTNYNKANPSSPTGGGVTTNSYNNILWGNTTTIGLANSSMLFADHNDFGNTNWPGGGNIDVDPLFVNPAQRDYRLQPGSACLGTGRDGEDMGVHFPVGSPLAPSHPQISSLKIMGNDAVLEFWADNEKSYSVLFSDAVSGGIWTKVTDVLPTSVPRTVAVTNSITEASSRFYRLVAPMQP